MTFAEAVPGGFRSVARFVDVGAVVGGQHGRNGRARGEEIPEGGEDIDAVDDIVGCVRFVVCGSLSAGL